MRIKPFAALRPPPDLAAEVASLPYDVGELSDARREAAATAKSFLHVERPEVDLPNAFALGDDHAGAARHLVAFQQNGWLVREAKPALYIYRLQLDQHVQFGLIACCHIEDYRNDVIKKHEKTKKPVEDQRTQHVLKTNANTGPIFLLYKDDAEISIRVASAASGAPLFDFVARDKIRHTVWTLSDPGPFIQAFANVPCAYIADGHHRAASAARAGIERKNANPHHRGDEEYNWFLAVLFPASQLKILAYDRFMKDLNGLSPAAFIAQVRERFEVTDLGDMIIPPSKSGYVNMYISRRWYALKCEAPAGADPVSAMDVSVLQNRLLGPVLGIDDPRTNSRIGYLGGFGAVEELKRRVDTSRASVAFCVHPTTVDQLMAISDAGQIMPPKSTWFEPKLRSGLFVHLLD